MIIFSIFSVACYLSGAALVRVGAPSASGFLTAVLAYPLGLALWGYALAVGNMVLGMPFSQIWTWTFVAASVVVYGLASRRQWRCDLPLIAAASAALAVLNLVDTTLPTSDSFYMQSMADQIVFGRGIMPDDIREKFLIGYPLYLVYAILPAMDTAWSPAGTNIPPVMMVTAGHFIALLCYILWMVACRALSNHFFSTTLVASALIFVFSSPSMFGQIFYFNNHLNAAFFLMLAAYTTVNPLAENGRGTILPAVAMAALCLTRLEGVSFACLIPFMTAHARPKGSWWAWAGSSALIGILYTGYYLHGTVSEYANITLNHCLLLISIGVGLIVAHLRDDLFALAQTLSYPGFLLACLAVGVWGYWSSPSTMNEGVGNLFRDIFFSSWWSFTWWAILIALFYARYFLFTKIRLNLWIRFAFAYVFGVFVLNALRLDIPYTAAWTDSGNRMVVHVLPMAVIGIVVLWRDILALCSGDSANIIGRQVLNCASDKGR